jgi:2',3'-cyclic-nucleotide 2'-phosphodiesterase
MRILFCGDIVGRSGRDVVLKEVPRLREELKLDFVVVNAENAAHGFGMTPKICDELLSKGIDCITSGNHMWDQREIIPYIDREKRLVRPLNFPPKSPGQGVVCITTPKGQNVVVINIMCRLFMAPVDDPFQVIESALSRYQLGNNAHAIIVDVHGEASSEKISLAYVCDGRVSLVVGTHTHVPTIDTRVLEKGTAFQTDAGMCGDYNSVTGMEKEIPIFKFQRQMPSSNKMQPAQGPGTLCGTFVETDDQTGLAKRIEPVRIGPILPNHIPSLIHTE